LPPDFVSAAAASATDFARVSSNAYIFLVSSLRVLR
jgi:hypothetical protein